jgi:YbbR domain-containing protein
MVKRILKSLFVENAALKAFSLVLAIALVVLVRGERDAVTTSTIKVFWNPPQDRVLMNEPVDQVRVTVAGPLSRINRLERRDIAPMRIDLTRVYTSEFVFSPTLVELPPGLRVVSISPSTATLKFDKRVSKSVPVRPKVKGTPAPGYALEGAPASIPAEVVLEGAKSVVDHIDGLDTELLDVTGATGNVTREARLMPLPRFSEVRGSPVVRVAVKVVSLPVERTLTGLVVRTGPDVVADPKTVEVSVRGPRDRLERLTPESLAVAVPEGSPGNRGRVEVTGLPPQVVVIAIEPPTVQLVWAPPRTDGDAAAPAPPKP